MSFRCPESRARLAVLCAVSMCAGVAGCAGDRPAAAWSVAVDTLANGAVRVVNVPPGSGGGPDWVLEEEVRIGAIDGGGEESFGEVRGIAVDAEGRIAVLDAQAREIRVFGPDGGHLRTLGGRGGGPGELERPIGLAWAPDGLLRVPDVRNARMSLFDPAEGFARSHPMRFWSWGYIWSGAVDSLGRVWESSMGRVGDESWDMVRVYDDSMRLLDSIPFAARPARSGPDRNPPGAFFWESGGGWGYSQVPYYPHGARRLDPRGAFWETEAGDPAYRVTRWVPGGDTTLVFESSRPPVPVSRAERDSAIAMISGRIRDAGGDADLDWSRIPTTKPSIEGLFLAENGDIWVRVPTPGDSTALYDVFTSDGRYTGTARASLNISPWLPPVIRGDRFYALVLDDLGVPYVVRARVRAEGPAG